MRNAWRRWPRWVGGAAAGCAGLVTVTGLYWVCGGLLGLPFSSPPVGWAVAVVGAAGVVSALGRVAWLSWTVFALLSVSTFSLVMDLVVLLATGRVDDWPQFAGKLVRAAGVPLFAGAALAAGRTARGRCARCGQAHVDRPGRPLSFPAPTAAPRAVRWAAYVGAAAFFPYIAMKTVWSFGGRIGTWEGPVLVGTGGLNDVLARAGIDLTAVLGVLAVFLVLALTRPWSQVWPRWTPFLAERRVPRWLPLTPAFLGAATLGPYGVAGGAVAVAGALGDVPAPAWVVAVGLTAFGASGIALAVTGISYLRRTRPVCSPAADPIA